MIYRAILGFCLLLGLLPASRAATVTATFDDPSLPVDTFNDNGGVTGFLTSGGASFYHFVDPQFGSWASFDFSSITDTSLTGFSNELGVLPGHGAGGSTTFAIAETFAFPSTNKFNPADAYLNLPANTNPLSVEFVNSTYTYTSMTIGDSFVGLPFSDGDFLRMDIIGFAGLNGTGTPLGTVSTFLANFLNGNHSYVTDWTLLDISALVGAKSLRIGLESSRFSEDDGMSTPAYVGLDNFTFAIVPEPSSAILLLTALVGLAILRRRFSH